MPFPGIRPGSHEVRVGKPTRSFLFDADQPLVYCWEIPGDAPADARAVCAIADQLYQLGRGIDPAWAAAAILESEEAETLLFGHPGILSVPAGRRRLALPWPRDPDQSHEAARGRPESFQQSPGKPAGAAGLRSTAQTVVPAGQLRRAPARPRLRPAR